MLMLGSAYAGEISVRVSNDFSFFSSRFFSVSVGSAFLLTLGSADTFLFLSFPFSCFFFFCFSFFSSLFIWLSADTRS